MFPLLQRNILIAGAGAFCAALAACGERSTPDALPAPMADERPAFPGALGWAAITPGGRGGDIIRVTTLDASGPGSFLEAVHTKGPRIIVFEVGGVIDLGGVSHAITEPYLTIAGQTAPSPGITFIRGGFDIRTHDVVIRHIRVRPGDKGAAKKSGDDDDAIGTIAARNVIVDHCTLTWATDENLSASGPRFTGDTPDDWRRGTSHNITFSNNILAQGLGDSIHPKGEHSKGSLIHDNVSNILIYGNLYAHNVERNPLFKGGVRGAIVNNFIYNPRERAIHYNLHGLEWGSVPYETGRMTVVGNVMRAGPSTNAGLPMIMLGADGDLMIYERDNIAVDMHGSPLPMRGRYGTGRAEFIDSETPLDLPPGLESMPARDVEKHVLATAGARPWDRDAYDVQLLSYVAEGRGSIIDSQDEVGGYPRTPETRRAFDPALWDLDTMEPLSPDALDSGVRARGT